MKPASPYVLADRTIYHPAERCGQGPYRVETDSVPAKFGEELVVYACSKHSIAGNYRRTTTRTNYKSKPEVEEGAFSTFSDRTVDNAACKAKDIAVASSGGASTTSHTFSGGTTGSKGVTAAAPTTLQSRSLEAGGTLPADCSHVDVTDIMYTASEDTDPLVGHVAIDLWSDEPNDLEGLVLVVEHHVVRADMTIAAWKTYNDAYDKWVEALSEHAKEDVSAGLATWVDTSVKTPPPPAPRAEIQSPRPSQHARWIPGYWVYADASFHWIAGMWDVPDEDIKKELTVQAPTPPPSTPKTDTPTEARPTATAVWTPGSWQWDGRAYIWVAGAWRIPPDEHHTWQPPSWAISAGHSVFRPGGWRVSVSFGR